MSQDWVLVTWDYPPVKGGVARYLADLVEASKGMMRVMIPPSTQRRWWSLISVLRRLLQDEKTRVFISHILPIGTAAWIASWLVGARRGEYIILFHGLDLRVSQRSWIRRWLTQRIVRSARAVCVNSVFVAGECIRIFPWVKPILLTPGYTPRVLPERVAARQILGLQDNEVILLNVARLVSRKGLDRLIEVLPELSSHLRAVSIGEGPDRARLEGLAKANQARITFLGAADDTIRDLWYAAADIFVFPVRDEGPDVEGYGIVCLEAAAAGLPVIVGMGGGAPETVVSEETGLVVDAMNPVLLRRAIERLASDPVLRHAMGERGRMRALANSDWATRWQTLAELA